MKSKLSTIIVNTKQLDLMLQFYSALGVNFEKNHISHGTEIYRGLSNGIEFKLIATQKFDKKEIPQVQFSFECGDIEETYQQLIQIPHVLSLLDVTEMNGHRRAMLLDPDGHSVELFE